MRRRRTAVFFLILGISLSAIAVALNVGWILLNLTEVALLVFGVIFFALIITGLILNTIFLVREIRRNEQHDAFLNAVTHELKTPIASIKLYLDTLRTREIDEAKRANFYAKMHADNERLLGTVEQVLAASRARERGGNQVREEIDLAELVNEAAAIVIARNHLENAAIRVTLASGPIRVAGERGELLTVFLNLFDNAVKYSAGDVRVSVRLKRSRRGKAEVYIRDRGIGIPGHELSRIFKRFYRSADRSGHNVRGTGLGLAIVRSIVRRHGGQVRADSRGPGYGSTFVVRLPAK